MNALEIYLTIGGAWTIYALLRQTKLHGTGWEIAACALLNIFLWPLGIYFAWTYDTR